MRLTWMCLFLVGVALSVTVSEAFFAGANKKLTRDEIRVKLAHMLAPAHQVAPHVDETWPEVDESDALLNMTGSGSASGSGDGDGGTTRPPPMTTTTEAGAAATTASLLLATLPLVAARFF